MTTNRVITALLVVVIISHASASPSRQKRQAAACDSTPCKNGGVCSNEVDGGGAPTGDYKCECTVDYAGNDCEIQCGKADVMFIVDASGSIGDANWPPIVTFLKDLTNAFNVKQDKVRIGAIRYSTNAEMLWTMDSCNSAGCVTNNLDNMAYSQGSTNTSGALWMTWNQGYSPSNGNRSDAKDICILFTDGRSNKDTQLTIPYGQELKDRGCSTFVVAIGPPADINQPEIDAIASEPLSTFKLWLQNRNFDELVNFIPPIVSQACLESQKSDPCGSNPCQRGAACTVLNANQGTYTCDCPAPYTAPPNCAGFSCDPMEVCFVVDGSSSVTPQMWPKVLEFMKNTVDDIDISDTAIRFGVVTFSTQATLEAAIGTYNTKTDLKSFIDTIAFPTGGTETMRGIELALDGCLAGARAGAQKKIFIMTDGSYRANAESDMTTQLDKCKAQNVEVFSIGFGSFVNIQQLYKMASDFNNVLREQSLTILANRATDLIKSLCGPRPCSSGPCHNGGACKYDRNDPGGYNGYTCQCPNQYVTGALCQNLNYCSSNPCKNGGSCSDTPGGPVCSCTAQWMGSVCDKIPCGPADLCFLVDGSLSVNATTWTYVKQFLNRMVDYLNVADDDVRVGITEFSTFATYAIQLDTNNDKNALQAEINNLVQSKGGTETGTGLETVHDSCFETPRGSAVRKLAVIIVDGYSPRAQKVEDAVDNLVKNKNVDTAAIAYGSSIARADVQQQVNIMANRIPGRQFLYPDPLDLITNAGSIAQSFCSDTDYCSSSPCLNGGVCQKTAGGYTCQCPNNLPQPHCVDPCSSNPCPNSAPCVTSGSSYSCQCPGALLSPNCVCPATDVCIIMDTSYSVSETSEWPIIRNWGKNLFNRLSSNEIKVGAGVFSTNAYLDFAVGGYNDKNNGLYKMGNIKFVGGGTETVKALQLIRKSCFIGGRANAKKIAVLVVDGDYRDPAGLLTESAEVQALGIEVIAIGYKYASTNQLNTIVRGNTNRYFKVGGAADMNDSLAATIETIICDKGTSTGL